MLKSLAASQLVYILSPLESNYKILKEITSLLLIFLWSDKGDKIKRNVVINDYLEGGIKMIDIFSFNKSLKATWIIKYLKMLTIRAVGKHSSIWSFVNLVET